MYCKGKLAYSYVNFSRHGCPCNLGKPNKLLTYRNLISCFHKIFEIKQSMLVFIFRWTVRLNIMYCLHFSIYNYCLNHKFQTNLFGVVELCCILSKLTVVGKSCPYCFTFFLINDKGKRKYWDCEQVWFWVVVGKVRFRVSWASRETSPTGQ